MLPFFFLESCEAFKAHIVWVKRELCVQEEQINISILY